MGKQVTQTLTRRSIIKALRTEPLAPGQWARTDAKGKTEKNCPVCAVGAVVRHCIFKGKPPKLDEDSFLLHPLERVSEDVTQHALPSSGDVELLLEEKNYMGALTNFFEQQHFGRITPKKREIVIDWVKRNFPKEIEVTYEALS